MFVLLLANGLLEMWSSYQEHKASLIRFQREQADAAAVKITQFINEIVSQVRMDHPASVFGWHPGGAPLRRGAAAAPSGGAWLFRSGSVGDCMPRQSP